MSKARKLWLNRYYIASAIAIVSFALVGIAYLAYCYLFGFGTGMFGVKNTWGSDETEMLVSGVVLLVLAAVNPIRTRQIAVLSSVALISMGSFQTDRMIASVILLVVLWSMYFLGVKSSSTDRMIASVILLVVLWSMYFLGG